MRRYIPLTLLLLFALTASIRAENAVRFGSASMQPGESFSVDITLENETIIGGFVIPFRWSSPYLLFDSVTFVTDRMGGTPMLLLREVNLQRRIAGVIMVRYPAIDSTPPYVLVGSGPVARAYFKAAGNAPSEIAFVDSAYTYIGNSLDARLELSTYNGQTVHPTIVPGVIRIGNPPAATISVNPSSLFFEAESGDFEPADRLLDIRSDGLSQFDWEAEWMSSWLDVLPPIGKTPATSTAIADAFLLFPGVYYDTIVISSPIAENSPVLVPVAFVVDTQTVDAPEGFNFSLGQSKPSPFVAYSDPETRIPFLLEEPSHVVIELFDILGRRVKTLTSSTYGAGEAEVVWDGRDARGKPAASGHYICRMSTESGESSRVIVLIR